jgi:uncharacterized delta-60 repeat protein
LVDLIEGRELAYSIAPGPGDTFYIGGTGGTEGLLFVARLNADGTRDSTFGDNGVTVFPLPGDDTWGVALALHVQPDGKVLAAGTGGSGTGAPSIVRLLPDGTPDPLFGTGGGTVTFIFDEPRALYGGEPTMIAIQPNGRIVTGGTALGDFGQAGFVLARYNCAVVTPAEPTPPGADATALTTAPNPTRGSAVVSLALDMPTDVRLVAYDVLGRQVAAVHDGWLSRGLHEFAFDASRLPPGAYLLRAVADDLTLERTITVIR